MGAFKLGKMTFGSLFKKPETVRYPLEKKPQPEGLKGQISIDVQDCILCGLCDRSCPTDCIVVDKQKGSWAINRYQCIQCGYCVTVCPKDCLSMDPDYAPTGTDIAVDTFEVHGSDKPVTKNSPDAENAPEPRSDAKVLEDSAKEDNEGSRKDAVLEAKLAIMDEEKAEKVRAVLAARS